ncbi:OprO/OprP family phosphate-selective porin [Anatilimnocola floriformis]|uniref:OprO/OprP family phosphate-selective porin n=1 Tax=Anatilimnocola floriformis TaxID=2948575 RepID=UPI0020C2ECFD|nr:porin [Anatilimnocola floriformis]
MTRIVRCRASFLVLFTTLLTCALAPGVSLAQGQYGPSPGLYAPPGAYGPHPTYGPPGYAPPPSYAPQQPGYAAQPAAYPQQQQPQQTEIEAIFQRLQQQDNEIERLRSQMQSNQPSAENPDASHVEQANLLQSGTPNPKKEEKKDAGWKDMSTDKWTVKLGGHVQLDYINWADASPQIVGDDNYFSYRRLRLVADGSGYGQFDFRLQMSLEPGSGSDTNPLASPDVKDAYFSMNDIPWLGRARIGNFFVPFGLEQVTNDTNNMFNERSIPTQGIFTADREVGFAFYNCNEAQNVTWTWGMFFDDISDTVKSRLDDNQGYRLSGRLTWLPYYDEPSNGRYLVHTGIGGLHTDDYDDIARFRARPQIQRGPFLIDSGNIGADTYDIGNVEGAVVWGPVTVQGEAYVCNINRNVGGPVTIGGAYTHMSYFVTGENRIFERFGQHGPQFGRNQPITNFFAVPGCYGSGALELKARWSYLDLTPLDRGEYNDFTFGFNWYLTDRTRVMFDWIHPFTTADAVFGTANADIIAMRFDFNW